MMTDYLFTLLRYEYYQPFISKWTTEAILTIFFLVCCLTWPLYCKTQKNKLCYGAKIIDSIDLFIICSITGTYVYVHLFYVLIFISLCILSHLSKFVSSIYIYVYPLFPHFPSLLVYSCLVWYFCRLSWGVLPLHLVKMCLHPFVCICDQFEFLTAFL